MPLSQADKDDVLMTFSIELERMFTVVANHYSRDHYVEHALLLPEIEEKIRTSLMPIVE